MLTEITIEKEQIISAVEDNYDVVVASLSFIPGGEASWGYKVTAQDGQIYFFKIHTALENYDQRFALIYRLFTQGGITNITHPIQTKNKSLVVTLDTYPCALFPFITGWNAAQKPLTDSQRFVLGELLGRIHKAKEMIGDFQLREDFRYGNASRLLGNLAQAPELAKQESVFIQKTATLLVENREKILVRLQALHDVGDRLRNQPPEFVICHGEPHTWNTMVNQNQEVFLIDWDDCLVAPKEKDLRAIGSDTAILDGYRHIIGDVELNAQAAQYYRWEWNISEIDAWSESLFYGKANDIQNQHFLDELARDFKELETI